MPPKLTPRLVHSSAFYPALGYTTMKPTHKANPAAELVTAENLKLCLQVSLRTIRAWQAANVIPYVKVGKSVRFNPAKVIAALESAHEVPCRPPVRN